MAETSGNSSITLKPMTLKDLIIVFQSREMVSPRQLAKLTGLSIRSIYRWTDEGRLEYYKVGDRLYLPIDQAVEVDHVPCTLPLPDRVLRLCHWTQRTAGASGCRRSTRGTGAPG